MGEREKTIKYRFGEAKEQKQGVCRAEQAQATADDYATRVGLSNPTPASKKDSIVDTISAMEFCFLCEKYLIFALLPLISADLRAFFL